MPFSRKLHAQRVIHGAERLFFNFFLPQWLEAARCRQTLVAGSVGIY